MKPTITFRHSKPSPAIKEYVEERLQKIERFMGRPSEVRVILNVEKNLHLAEVLVATKGFNAQGHASTHDMYASIDDAIDKVETALRRHHDKKVEANSRSVRPVEVL